MFYAFENRSIGQTVLITAKLMFIYGRWRFVLLFINPAFSRDFSLLTLSSLAFSLMASTPRSMVFAIARRYIGLWRTNSNFATSKSTAGYNYIYITYFDMTSSPTLYVTTYAT